MTTSGPLAMAVVVVSLNTRDILQKCLESVLAAAPAEMVVVDNRSTDGSPDLVRALFPSVRLIASDTNLGYGGAANRGIAACSAPAVLLLNSDTVTSVTLPSAGAAATATVAGSPYPVVPSAAVGAGLGNYTISYANGKLTVKQSEFGIKPTSAAGGLVQVEDEVPLTFRIVARASR